MSSRVIRCQIVSESAVSAEEDPAGKDWDLSPWADPYIAQLVANLQAEGRAGRQRHSCRAEAPPGLPETETFGDPQRRAGACAPRNSLWAHFRLRRRRT